MPLRFEIVQGQPSSKVRLDVSSGFSLSKFFLAKSLGQKASNELLEIGCYHPEFHFTQKLASPQTFPTALDYDCC